MKSTFYPGDRMKWDIYQKVLEKIKLNQNEKILAGCGQGILADYLRERERERIEFIWNRF